MIATPYTCAHGRVGVARGACSRDPTRDRVGRTGPPGPGARSRSRSPWPSGSGSRPRSRRRTQRAAAPPERLITRRINALSAAPKVLNPGPVRADMNRVRNFASALRIVMEHVVFYPAACGVPAFRRVSSLDEAVNFVEHLRNVENITDFSVHELTPVQLSLPRLLPRRRSPGG